ncbi:MAG TPA: DUF1343 domain-containing protein [Candidatus Limnocylindria bacterium]|nr:DUF1343 domain-containing protein [Candidatus Limnocylindria bacterium]
MTSGLEVLLRDGHPLVDGRRVALLTHPAGVDRGLRSAVELMTASRRWTVVALFGPEHGIRGDAEAGVQVASAADPRTGLVAHSLYGATRVPTDEMLAESDVLVVDLQDIGVRYFTYPATVVGCIKAAAARRIDVVILDRPAPLTGSHVEGGLLRPAHRSFVGAHDVPIRHGLTLGELVRLVAAERELPAPAVVPVEGWRRALWYDETGLPWVAPSPNLPTLDAVLVYAGTCLIEGTNLSEGRGTTRPFSLVGAPWLDADTLASRLRDRAVPGIAARATSFVPTMSKHAGERCRGIELHVTDRDAARPTELGLALLEDCIAVSGDHLEWREAAFDRLAGDPVVRETLQRRASLDPLIVRWRDEARAFTQRRARHLLYADDGLS